MKSIGRSGSASEYTFFNENNFIHQGAWYERDFFNGRCYRLEEPCGIHSRIGRDGGMARRRISAVLFAHLVNECKAQISEAEKRGAA